jgi:ABC-type dipeptide/oligopeptide/nickel transport system ATPase subunit
MASKGTLIEIEDLTKVFFANEVVTHALSGIHLSIERGEYVAIFGAREGERGARSLSSQMSGGGVTVSEIGEHQAHS